MSLSHEMLTPRRPGEPESLKIGNRDVHLWYGKDPDMGEYLGRAACVLSPKELARSERYHFSSDRQRYVIQHVVLRMLTSGYLAVNPEDIQFGENDYGKLSVENTGQKEKLEFNISHSNEAVLFAFSLGRQIGVDIEFMRPIKEMDALIESNFSSNEKAEFAMLPLNKKHAAFYHCWTQKEAFVKALGEGMSRGLDQFDVSVAPDAPAALKRTLWNQEEARRWSLTAIHSIPGYAAALAVEGSGWVLQTRKLEL